MRLVVSTGQTNTRYRASKQPVAWDIDMAEMVVVVSGKTFI